MSKYWKWIIVALIGAVMIAWTIAAGVASEKAAIWIALAADLAIIIGGVILYLKYWRKKV